MKCQKILGVLINKQAFILFAFVCLSVLKSFSQTSDSSLIEISAKIIKETDSIVFLDVSVTNKGLETIFVDTVDVCVSNVLGQNLSLRRVEITHIYEGHLDGSLLLFPIEPDSTLRRRIYLNKHFKRNYKELDRIDYTLGYFWLSELKDLKIQGNEKFKKYIEVRKIFYVKMAHTKRISSYVR